MSTDRVSLVSELVTGLDPFDALRGTHVPSIVRGSPRLRQIAIQLRKRSPLDLSRIYGVAPFRMAKTVGCMLSAESRRARSGDLRAAGRAAALEDMLRWDDSLARSNGGWGYEFDVQTRWAFYPAGSPNVIATYFVCRGLLEHWIVSGSTWAGEAAVDAARFVRRELLCAAGHVSYTPTNRTLVHNANTLGAALLTSVGRLNGDDALTRAGLEAVLKTVDALPDGGLWPYGDTAPLSWIDNFHTAYTMDGLLSIWLSTRDARIGTALQLAYNVWSELFFGADGRPHYYADRRGPLDIHSAATAIDVGVRMAQSGIGSSDLPRLVADWTKRCLIAPNGDTYYQRHSLYTDRRHFRRWGDAHWALACSSLELAASGGAPLVEEALRDAAQ
jgi:hypothetical protein